ncbi:MAG: ABC transporter permease [Firmicutes bacterium]|nr:ABC transporter permease [Bacillota bacterium]
MMTIAKKELRGYFNSMIGFVFLVIMLGITGISFALFNVAQQYGSFQQVLSSTTIVYLFLTPITTMRLFAEEARQKTDQMLFTSPLSIVQIVLGKYFAALGLILIGTAVTIMFPLMIARYGTMPTGQIVSGYIGYILLAACYTAIGTFISTLTDNQIISAIITFVVLFVLMIFDSLTQVIPTTATASFIFIIAVALAIGWIIYNGTKNVFAGAGVAAVCIIAALVCYLANNLLFDGLTTKVIQWFSIMTRNGNFFAGVFKISDVVYHITFAALFVYLTVNGLQKRRWK